MFRAWTEPDQLDWFAGATQTAEHPTTVDLRPGGAWRVWLVQPDGPQYWTGGIYQVVDAPHRWCSPGGPRRAGRRSTRPGPTTTRSSTVTLRRGDGGTELTVQLTLADSLSEQRVKEWFAIGIRQGMSDTIDRLAPYLAALR